MSDKIKIIYGTGNPGKLRDMRDFLEGMDIELIGLTELGVSLQEPEECGNSPMENARQKAEYYYSVLKQPVFSCDTGLFIEGLAEEEQPGVHVRNVNGKRLNDAEMTAHYAGIARRLGGKCTARYKNAIYLILNETEHYQDDGEEMSKKPFYLVDRAVAQVKEGYPLDPISIDPVSGNYFAGCDDFEGIMLQKKAFRRFFENALRDSGLIF